MMSTIQPQSSLPRSRTRHGAAYVERGEGAPLVLVHGVGMRLEAWAPQIAALASGHRVIAVDMPGHGASEQLAAAARLPDFVAWLGRFLDDLLLDAISIAGHSMGALIAGGAAASFGARIRRVALLNGVYRRGPAARAAVLERAKAIRLGHIDVEGPLKRWFGDRERGTEACRLTREWLSGVDRQGYATAYAAFAEGDATYADAWPRITCPALFLTGEDDPNSTPAMAEAMAASTPCGVARIIAGHRHMVNLTAPEIVNGMLEEWLAREEVTA
ncbi:alpha/beta fold hydrolase [Manganibacter manganicus]|uniref:Alpha/beta hydrolase n=1 Tax=Manganibacter manganicus TaxID=1873176 RepID=A0A1V8RM62_9HYPH|nr:alpha/beta fold hydrolase [Pseudaminobacter manganicus]OQM74234.1 alpha/beta hydrolase [Pseudaminobacter manganicus]